MPFNIQTFKTRALTAIVFVIVMLVGILWNQWSFLALFFFIHVGCWIEFQKLLGLIDPNYSQIHSFHRYGIILAGSGLLFSMTTDDYSINGLLLSKLGGWLFLIGMILFILSVFISIKKTNIRLVLYSIGGLFYISLSWALMMRLWGNLHQSVFIGENWMTAIILIASIWINDTMAYFVGSIFGKTPLSPISPKKTWEGTIGGGILTVLVVILFGYFILEFPIKSLLIVSISAAIAGTLGDLFESKLKRLAGVKDSGQFMPGHGGFLDRFDSLLVATTTVWFLFYLVY
jgi:phosphatidate cytidylyltransferase